ncbi:hypothetical protein [Larkinella terrae]|uniref:Uncharacterized protein n=1 Tax=Larkinella terrae TaxID=2025311 RepID=A0A7K0EIX6_9BACT|nr:hypothetical protein [Larkinella terrae]MRS61744.1 hypothetical protein [Larkinella terrae]
MTPTEHLIKDFCRRHPRIWHMEMAESLERFCWRGKYLHQREKESAVQMAYCYASAFINECLPDTGTNRRPWLQMNLVALLLKANGQYGRCKELHFDAGLALLQSQPLNEYEPI